MEDSGATDYMTQDPVGLKDYVPAPAGQHVQGVGGILLSVVGYGRVHLLVSQGIGNFKDPALELALKRVATCRIKGSATCSRNV